MGQLTTARPGLRGDWYSGYGADLDAAVRTTTTRTVTAATTLVNTDEWVRINSASAVSQPVPSGMPSMSIYQLGAGQVTLTAGTGVTLTGRFKTASQYSAITIIPTSATTYDVVGGVA